MIDISETKFMPVSVFEGGNGDLVLCQEWPSVDQGERFMGVMLNMKDADRLATEILAVARVARGKDNGGR